MESARVGSPWPVHLALGLAAGLAIVLVDNVWSGGEVSPIAIVALLLVATFATGAAWGRGGWIGATAAWACVPLAHVAKHLLGAPDTLQPNTYLSILYLAGFCLFVSVFGFGLGTLAHRVMNRDT